MATPQKLRMSLRSDGRTLDSVDRDLLTPTAAAMFDAIQAGSGPDLHCYSRQTRRELGQTDTTWFADAELDKPIHVSWRGWSYYPADSAMDIHEYLNREAMKIDPRYQVGRGPAYPATMTSAQVLAALERAGRPISASTWRSYVARGQAPGPVDHVGRTPVWDASAIGEWIAKNCASPEAATD